MDDAKKALKEFGYPCVIKVDGLASGKGVVIVESKADAEEYLRLVFEEKKFGNAANRILVEEYLEGEEVSFMVITDGKKFVPLAPAKDYKKADDGDTGPNTGGMGAHSPAVVLNGDTATEIVKTIMLPTIQGMAEEGRSYSGCLYAGLILTRKGPKVLEYNCRFGDPETQSLLPRLEGDLLDALAACAAGSVADVSVPVSEQAAVTVVLAGRDYPERGDVGTPIEGIAAAEAAGALVFHAGTAVRDGRLVTNGGRILNVTALGDSVATARAAAYEAASHIDFAGVKFRRDIAHA